MEMKEGEVKVKSLQKALEVLNCFTEKSAWGVTELSEYLGLYKSNVYNILSTFMAMEYVKQDPETGKYRLGMAVYSLSHALGEELVIGNIAMPYMQTLSDLVGERAYLAIPHGDEVVYVASTYPQETSYLMRFMMGDRAKMYCTGIGKAIMAFLPEDVVDGYLRGELKSFTDTTITDPNVMKRELEEIRQRGYAIDNMEHEYGIKCIGMPIFNRQKKIEAALSLSGPSLRFSQESMDNMAQELRKTVHKIESRI